MPQQPMPVPDWNFANYVLNNNLVDKFELLRGVPGICLEPVSWGNIKKLVAGSSLEELSSLGRHPSGIVEYRKFRSKVLHMTPLCFGRFQSAGNLTTLSQSPSS